MDWAGYGEKLKGAVGRYKYVILVLLVGVMLMLLPTGRKEPDPAPPISSRQETMEQRLERILSRIDGAGSVQVLLTTSSGQETLYQSDQEIDTGNDTSTDHQKTVVVTDKDRQQQGLVRQVNPPKYQGAVIVCQGADRAQVRLDLIEAVADATGLSADRISVLKMK